MHRSFEGVGGLKSDFNNPGLVGLQDDVFQSTKQGNNPATAVESVSFGRVGKGVVARRKPLQRDVERIGGVSNVSNHSLHTPVLIWSDR